MGIAITFLSKWFEREVREHGEPCGSGGRVTIPPLSQDAWVRERRLAVLEQRCRAPVLVERVHRPASLPPAPVSVHPLAGGPDDGLWRAPPRRRVELAPRRPRRWPLPPAVVVVLAAAASVAALAVHREGSGGHVRVPLHACPFADALTGRCGRVRVPLDPSRPHGAAILLRVAILPATTQPPVGAVFYLEGGPSGGFFAAAAARDALLRRGCAAVASRRDPDASGSRRPLAVPALVLAGSADPQSAPYARRWPRLVATFVARGGPHGLDARCARRAPPVRFELG